jgi:hypothetical protein
MSEQVKQSGLHPQRPGQGQNSTLLLIRPGRRSAESRGMRSGRARCPRIAAEATSIGPGAETPTISPPSSPFPSQRGQGDAWRRRVVRPRDRYGGTKLRCTRAGGNVSLPPGGVEASRMWQAYGRDESTDRPRPRYCRCRQGAPEYMQHHLRGPAIVEVRVHCRNASLFTLLHTPVRLNPLAMAPRPAGGPQP